MPHNEIVILGANSFVGRSLAAKLRADGISPSLGTSENCDLLNFDSAKAFAASHYSGVSLWFFATVNKWRKDDANSLTANLTMLENALSAFTGKIHNVVFTSAADVYGVSPPLPVHEGTPTAPHTYYAKSKLLSEQILMDFSQRNSVPSQIFRLPGVYGPLDQGRSVLGGFIRRITAGERVELSRQGLSKRDFVYVDDLYDIFMKSNEWQKSVLANVATGTSLSILECIRIVERITGKKADLVFTSDKPNSPLSLEFDNRKIQAAFGEICFTPVTDGVRKYIDRNQ